MSTGFYTFDAITDAERAAGFRLEEVDNPDAGRFGSPPKIQAVVYWCSPSRIILKARLPGERLGYQLYHYGQYSWGATEVAPAWLRGKQFSIPDPAFVVANLEDIATLLHKNYGIVEVAPK
jgi:hypothetical protein